VNDHVQVIEPEINLLSFFQKAQDSKKYSKVYTVVPVAQPVRPSDQFEELKCGDIIRAGDMEYVVREFVDGRDRTKYSGVPLAHQIVKPEEDLNVTLFEDSVVMYDAGKSRSTR